MTLFFLESHIMIDVIDYFQNSFVTIYLIYVFTSLSALSIKVADIAGNTHR